MKLGDLAWLIEEDPHWYVRGNYFIYISEQEGLALVAEDKESSGRCKVGKFQIVDRNDLFDTYYEGHKEAERRNEIKGNV